MKPVKQTVFTNPETGKRGNCLAACLASLLEVRLGDVPRFQLMKRDHAERFAAAVEQHGCVFVGRKLGRPQGPGLDGYFIVSYTVVGHCPLRHCVIWKDGRIVFDPRDADIRLGRLSGYFDIQRSSHGR